MGSRSWQRIQQATSSSDFEPPRDVAHVFLSTYPYELPVRASIDWCRW